MTGRSSRSRSGTTTASSTDVTRGLVAVVGPTASAKSALGVDLARAFGVNSVTIFGPTNSKNWHYPSPGSLAVQAPPSKDQVCRLRNLSADLVIEAARQVF